MAAEPKRYAPGESEPAAAASPLEAIAAASRALADGVSFTRTLDTIVAAAAAATGAELAVGRVLDADARVLHAAAVASHSAALVAELDGSRLDVDELPPGEADERGALPEIVRAAAARIGAGAMLLVPVRSGERVIGSLEVARAGAAFGEPERLLARISADQMATAIRSFRRDVDESRPREAAAQMLHVGGEVLAAGSDPARMAHEIARLVAEWTRAETCLVWRREAAGGLAERPAACFRRGPSAVAPARLRALAEQSLAGGRPVLLERLAGGAVATSALGQPPLGALQLVFGADTVLPAELLARLGTFGVRAAHALRASERSRTVESELERTRALLEVVARVNEELSLAHTLATVVERVSELLDAERVGVYLLEEGRLVPAAGRALEGRHTPVAARLLELALGPFRGRGMLLIEDAPADARLTGLEREVSETGIEAAVAAPLLVGGEVTGLLAIYPARGRVLTPNEWTLLAALVAQLAVAVQNARLHERATRLGAELEEVLSAERQRSRQERALYEISRSFAQSLSLERTLEALATTVVELLEVDAAVIRMPDGRGEQLVPRALHVADESSADALRPILVVPQPLETLGRSLFRRGRPLVLDVQTAGRLSAYDPLVPFLDKGSTAVVLPIATPTELLGTLSVVSLDPARPLTSETIEIGLFVAAQAALALDNARLYQQQKEFADTMQRSLLPRSRPALPGFELGEVYESSARVDVGGDVYDFLRLDDGRLAVVLGDVTGHGIDAAADMAMAKFVFRSLAREHPEPGGFLAATNDVVCDEIAPGKFITMLYLTLDPQTGGLACASAGHAAPLLVAAGGGVERLEAHGLVLGIESGERYEEVRGVLRPGGSIVLFTDGVTEARRDGELYGDARLERLLSERHALPAEELARAVLADCRAWSGGELADDCAVVVIKRTGP